MLARACQPGWDLVPAEPNYLRGDKYTWVEEAPLRKIKVWCDSGRWWGAPAPIWEQQIHTLGWMSDRVPQTAPKQGRRADKMSLITASSHNYMWTSAESAPAAMISWANHWD